MGLTEKGFRGKKLLQTGVGTKNKLQGVKSDFHFIRVAISLLLSRLKTRRLYRWRKAKFSLEEFNFLQIIMSLTVVPWSVSCQNMTNSCTQNNFSFSANIFLFFLSAYFFGQR